MEKIKEYIRDIINVSSIKLVIIDLNGRCNNKCWFCPNRYVSQPIETQVNMPLDMAENIINQILNEKQKLKIEEKTREGKDLIIRGWNFNEIFLYPHLEGFLNLCRKYNILWQIASNGLLLNKDIVDMLIEYKDNISFMALNTPAGNAKDYKLYTGQKEESFYTVIDNINYLLEKNSLRILIRVNGVTNQEPLIINKKRYVTKYNVPKKDTSIHKKDLEKLLHGNYEIQIDRRLHDRMEILKDNGIFSNEELYPKKEQILSCCGSWREIININPIGDLFVCSQDYFMQCTFGNINKKNIVDIWYSEKHIDKIYEMMTGICRKCFAFSL